MTITSTKVVKIFIQVEEGTFTQYLHEKSDTHCGVVAILENPRSDRFSVSYRLSYSGIMDQRPVEHKVNPQIHSYSDLLGYMLQFQCSELVCNASINTVSNNNGLSFQVIDKLIIVDQKVDKYNYPRFKVYDTVAVEGRHELAMICGIRQTTSGSFQYLCTYNGEVDSIEIKVYDRSIRLNRWIPQSYIRLISPDDRAAFMVEQ